MSIVDAIWHRIFQAKDSEIFTGMLENTNEFTVARVVRMMLTDPRVDPGANDNIAIWMASQYGYTEIVKLLLADPRVDPGARENVAIWMASQYGYTEVVRLLLADPRVDPSTHDNIAIRWASEYGYTEVVKLLLADPRVDPDANNNEAIRWASSYGHTEVVRLLLADPRVDPGANNNEAIQSASYHGYTEIVRLLENRGAVEVPPLPLRVPIGTIDCISYDEVGVGDILVDFHDEWSKYGRCYKESYIHMLKGINPFTRQRITSRTRYIVV